MKTFMDKIAFLFPNGVDKVKSLLDDELIKNLSLTEEEQLGLIRLCDSMDENEIKKMAKENPFRLRMEITTRVHNYQRESPIEHLRRLGIAESYFDKMNSKFYDRTKSYHGKDEGMVTEEKPKFRF